MICAALLLAMAMPVQESAAWTKEQLSVLRPLRARIAALTEDLGEFGFTRHARACERAYAALGALDREQEALTRRLNKALEKAADSSKLPDPRKLSRLAAMASVLAADLLGAAGNMEPEAARRIAAVAVLLDDSLAEAHAQLGEARSPDGRWGSPAQLREWEWRRSFARAVQTARDLPFEFTEPAASDPLLPTLSGPPLVVLEHGVARFEGRMPRSYLENRFRHLLRAGAVSAWLASGELAPHFSEFTMVWTWAGQDYEDYLHAARARDQINDEELRMGLRMSASMEACRPLWQPTRGAMLANSTDYDFSTLVRFDHSLTPGSDFGAHRALEIGRVAAVPPWMQHAHLYLAGMAYFGDGWLTLPQLVADHPETWKPTTEEEVWMDTGWSAVHHWNRAVLRRAALPGLDLLREHSNWHTMKGAYLFQGVSVLEFLYARSEPGSLWPTVSRAAAHGLSESGIWTRASLRAMLDAEPDAFETEWRAWLDARVADGEAASVAQALTDPTVEDLPARTALKAVNALRELWGLAAVVEDPAASAGCREHAQWLVDSGTTIEDWTRSRRRDVDDSTATAEGFWAATHGASMRFEPEVTVEQLVERLAASLFHRVLLQQPILARAGAASHGEVLTLDLESWSSYWMPADLRWPRDATRGVPTHHASGVPSPVAGQASGTLGYPVTLFRFPLDGDLPAEMSLANQGSIVHTLNLQPHDFLGYDLSVRGLYAMIPLAPLERDTEYDVEYRFADETVQWSFRTAK